MLESIFNDNVTIESVLLCSICAIILGVVIAISYKISSRYSKNFLITITMLPILVMAVMIMVNGNLGTGIATAGAFSLIRFRSIPGSSKEILVVFFAMAVGLAIGMGHLVFATLLTIIAAFSLVFLSKIKLYDNNNEKILKIVIPENLDYTNIFVEEFNKYTINNNLESVKTINMGSLFELTYKILLKNEVNEKEFIDDIRIKNGNLKVMLSQPLNNENDCL